MILNDHVQYALYVPGLTILLKLPLVLPPLSTHLDRCEDADDDDDDDDGYEDNHDAVENNDSDDFVCVLTDDIYDIYNKNSNQDSGRICAWSLTHHL